MTQYPVNREIPNYLPSDYEPSNKDILCGRGKLYSKHDANIKYTEAIANSLQQYKNTPKRIGKSAVVSSVVHKLREEGYRFIRFEKKKDLWYELSAETTHEKTGHAIRDLLEQQQAHASGISRTTMRKQKRLRAATSSPTISKPIQYTGIAAFSLRRHFSLPEMPTSFSRMGANSIIDEVLRISSRNKIVDPTPLSCAEDFDKPIFSDPLLSAELLNVLSDDDSDDDMQHDKSLRDSDVEMTTNHHRSQHNSHNFNPQPEPTPLASDCTFPLKFAATSEIECEEMGMVLAALRRGSF